MIQGKLREAKTKIAAVIACAVCAALLGGCAGNGQSASQSASQSITDGTALRGTTATVQVQSIEGDAVTAVLGEYSRPEMGEAPSDGMPEEKAPSGSMPVGEAGDTPPEQPAGDGGDGAPKAPDGEAPSGNMPEGGGRGGVFTAGEETVTFIIPEGVSIQMEQGPETAEGSISDLAEGSVLEVTFDGDGAVTAVTIKQTGGMGGAPEELDGFAGATESTSGNTADAGAQAPGTI